MRAEMLANSRKICRSINFFVTYNLIQNSALRETKGKPFGLKQERQIVLTPIENTDNFNAAILDNSIENQLLGDDQNTDVGVDFVLAA